MVFITARLILKRRDTPSPIGKLGILRCPIPSKLVFILTFWRKLTRSQSALRPENALSRKAAWTIIFCLLILEKYTLN